MVDEKTLGLALARLRKNTQLTIPSGAIARRGFDTKFIDTVGLGYIGTNIADSQFKPQTLSDLYLTNPATGNLKYANHLLFPCYSPTGTHIGFIGRRCDESTEYKYILPQNIFYSKDTYIHDLHSATNPDYCVVCENVVEWGRCKALGFQAVSLVGATPSDFKAAVLSRYSHIILVSDNDAAGAKLKSFFKEKASSYSRKLSIIEHKYKGLDEFYLDNGDAATIQLINHYKDTVK